MHNPLKGPYSLGPTLPVKCFKSIMMVRIGAKDHQKTATVVKESTYETAQYLCLSYLHPSCEQISFKSFTIFFVVSLLREKVSKSLHNLPLDQELGLSPPIPKLSP